MRPCGVKGEMMVVVVAMVVIVVGMVGMVVAKLNFSVAHLVLHAVHATYQINRIYPTYHRCRSTLSLYRLCMRVASMFR